MSTAVDVARAGVADLLPVGPSSPLAKKRAPARRDVVPSDEVDVAVEGTPAPITAEAPAGKKRARSPDDSPVRPMRSLEDARDDPPPVRARRADASPRHPAALHPSTDEDADRLLVSLAVSAVRGVVAAPRGERASVSLDALRPRNPENTPAYLEVVRAFDTLRRELDLADADAREERGEALSAAAANLDLPSNEPSDGRLRPWEARIAEETRAESERREAATRRERELESERARLETVARELAVSLASVEKERAAAEATVRTARRETEEMRAHLADALARAVAAEKRAAAARDAASAVERRLEEAATLNAKETKKKYAKTGTTIDPRRALEFKRHLATHMKRLDGEAASLTSILQSGGGFTATEALAALGEMCEDRPDDRAATHMVVVHEI